MQWKTIARYAVAGLLLVLLLAAGWVLHEHPEYGPAASFAVVSGAAFGVILQRSRFCFYCILRESMEERDTRALLGVLVALGVGSVGYQVVYGAWIPDPTAGYLPPNAHIGPVSWTLLLGGVTFGVGMSLSGACISAHLYRLGEGYVLAPIALVGTAAGFGLGFLAWNTLYLRALSDAPVVWLPEHFGYTGSLLFQFALLAVLAVWLIRYVKPHEKGSEKPPGVRLALRAVFVHRWPTWIGGVALGVLAMFVYLRTEPLGVTAEIGRLSRSIFDDMQLLPARLEGLDGFRGCSTADTVQTFSSNALFISALVLASFAAALIAGQFKPKRQPVGRHVYALIGGVLLGFGAMISLGCTIGTLYSGITAFALSGWVFAAAVVAGVWLGLKIRRRVM